MFPHHENEIAQSEALTGKNFANYWSHCGLIKINGENMSKSLGNSLTIRDALKMYNYEVLKYVMFSKHYSSDIDILDSDYVTAEGQMYYFYNTIKAMQDYIALYATESAERLEDSIASKITEEFIEAMDDDFNTTAAIANLHGIFKYSNGAIKAANKGNREKTANTLKEILEKVKDAYKVLGFFTQEPEKFITELKVKYLGKLNMTEEEILKTIEERKAAKAEKNYALADEIRASLDEKGIILNDTAAGTVWDIKALY